MTTPSGRGSISEEHRLAFGSVGLYRTRSSARPVDEADCALFVGTRLEEFQTGLGHYLPDAATLIQVDVDPFEIERNIAADVAVVRRREARARAARRSRRHRVRERPWTVELAAFRAEYERTVESECSTGGTGPLRTKQVVHALNRVFPDGFVLVHENGGQDLWSYYCPFVKVTLHRGCVAPAEQTVMGLGVAGAIGARLGRPEADVVCVTGDGAFQMYMKEIPTALQHSAPVVWVVLDNASLHWVKWIARATGERYLAVDFDVQPDLVAVAVASGAHAERIETPRRARRRTRSCPERAARWAPGRAGVRDRHVGLPRGLRRVPSRRVGPRATRRREYDMSWIETGSTICFKPYTLEQALHGLSEAGFENVEIGAVKGFLEHLDPDRLGPAEIDETRRLLDRFGLRCVSLSGHASLHLDEGMQRLRNVLAAAKALRRPRAQHVHRGRRDTRGGRAVQGQRASARRRGAGRRHPAVHRDGLEPPAHRRDRDAAARRNRSRLDPDQLRPRQRRVLRRGQAGGRRQEGPRPVRARPPEGSARRQGGARLPSAR